MSIVHCFARESFKRQMRIVICYNVAKNNNNYKVMPDSDVRLKISAKL